MARIGWWTWMRPAGWLGRCGTGIVGSVLSSPTGKHPLVLGCWNCFWPREGTLEIRWAELGSLCRVGSETWKFLGIGLKKVPGHVALERRGETGRCPKAFRWASSQVSSKKPEKAEGGQGHALAS